MKNYNIEEIYLHIGIHKTGTSSIQETLHFNNKILKDKFSIEYIAEFPANQNEILYTLFNDDETILHMSQIVTKRTNQDIAKNKSNWQDILNKTIINSTSKKLIFSAEAMSSYRKEILININNFFTKRCPNAKIKVIVYVRDVADYYKSANQ